MPPHAGSRPTERSGNPAYSSAWVTIRFSGTEPVLRVFAEAETLAEAERLAACVATHLGLED